MPEGRVGTLSRCLALLPIREGTKLLLRENEALSVLGAPDVIVPERVHTGLEPAVGVEEHVDHEASFKFEEGSVAVLPQLVAMEVTELRDLLRVPPLRPTLAKITENVSESAIQHHLVHCCLSDRGRFTSRQLEAVDSAPENPTTLERLGSIGSTDDNIREEPAEVNIHAHDPLESIRNHLRIPNAIHDHFTNRGPEPEETFKNVSFPVVAHDFLL